MKNEKFMRSIGNVADKYIEEAAPQKKASDNLQTISSKRNILHYLPIAACITIFLFGTTAFAANYIQNNISSFYLRYLWPEDMAVADSMAEHYGAKVYFDGLKSDDWYKQYFAINKLVEYYNDEKVRTEAIHAITPFLTNDEKKLADAAAFSLSILTQAFDDPRIIHLADDSVVFTLFNDYSDYGSYNQLWRIKDGELTVCMSLNTPHMYIRHIIPSPDNKLIAVVTGSNKSEYVWIYDLLDGFVSKELIDSARILVAKDMGYAVLQRIDFENYSGLVVDLVPDENGTLRWGDGRSSIYWVDNNTLEFIANLRGDLEEIEEFEATAIVRYDFRQKHMEYSLTTNYTFADTRASFSIDYPSSWKVTEQIGAEGNAEHEASPDTGIEFDFSKNENEKENFFIRAMLFSSLSFDRENYEQEDFITDDNLPATKYTRINEDESISVFYVFDETEHPCYFAGVNMSIATYDKYKEDIQNVIKSFKPVK